MLGYLQEEFPAFQWRMPVRECDELTSKVQEEPTKLLEYGLAERNLHRWDFTVLVKGVDLVSYHRPYALAVVSRALDSLVVSTSRLDPRMDEPSAEDAKRVKVMARRVTAIVLRALGHLNGLAHSP